MESAVGGGVEMDGDAGIGSTGALHRSFTPLAIVGHSATNSGSVDDFWGALREEIIRGEVTSKLH